MRNNKARKIRESCPAFETKSLSMSFVPGVCARSPKSGVSESSVCGNLPPDFRGRQSACPQIWAKNIRF
jgi:hypothetical protein